jgi:hypothetical protein
MVLAHHICTVYCCCSYKAYESLTFVREECNKCDMTCCSCFSIGQSYIVYKTLILHKLKKVCEWSALVSFDKLSSTTMRPETSKQLVQMSHR